MTDKPKGYLRLVYSETAYYVLTMTGGYNSGYSHHEIALSGYLSGTPHEGLEFVSVVIPVQFL